MKSAVFIVLFVSLLNSAFPQNLVINPGLESWESTDKPAGWTTSTKCTSEAVIYHSGSLACMHAGSTSSRGDMGQMIPVSPGKKYTLSLYYMTGTPTTGMGARVWCYWKNSEGSSITDPATDNLLRSGYLSGYAWTQYMVDITAPAGAVALYLEVRTYINSIMYWDDFVFEESIVTGIAQDDYDEILIFPVLADDCLNIRGIQSFNTADIINMNGKTLRSFSISGNNELSIRLTDIAEGIYIMKFSNGKKFVMKKFIKRQ